MIAAILPVVVGQPSTTRVVRPANEHPPGASVLDRRGGPRHGCASVDRFTAASHRPLPMVFAVGTGGHWAVMTGVSWSPHGILLRALDPHEAALEAPEHDVIAAWRRMASLVGMRASPLWYSSTAIAAATFVGELALAAARGPTAIELVVLDGGGPLVGRHMHGVLAPLTDPTPAVLGVNLDADHRDALAAACAPTPFGRPAPRPIADLSSFDAPSDAIQREDAAPCGIAGDAPAPADSPATACSSGPAPDSSSPTTAPTRTAPKRATTRGRRRGRR